MENAYKECSCCILDTNDCKEISFDEKGVCNFCRQFDETWKQVPKNDIESEEKLLPIIDRIKREGAGKEYDCLLGVSGGVDSSYVAKLVNEWGLRPLAVHFDNGWNSELAVSNIEKIITKLNVDLSTYVINWEDFKRLQLAYLRASVVDIEAITDHAIFGATYTIALENDIKYIVSGSNISTEAILPREWVHNKLDSMNIKSIFKKFGHGKIKTYPFIDKKLKNKIEKSSIEVINVLDLIVYDVEQAKKEIEDEFSWVSYEGKHFESIFTRFYQGYILPTKFGIDKRKAHLSNLICSNQMTREEALKEIKEVNYRPEQIQEDLEFVIKKLGLSMAEFEQIMSEPVRKHQDFDVEGSFFSHYPAFKPLRPMWSKLRQYKA